MIHPTAIIDESAKIGPDVSIGPYVVIGSGVEIGEGTWIGPHVVINGPTRIGRDNRIFQFNSIGDIPQDKKFEGEESFLEIGDRNTIREYCTFNRGHLAAHPRFNPDFVLRPGELDRAFAGLERRAGDDEATVSWILARNP